MQSQYPASIHPQLTVPLADWKAVQKAVQELLKQALADRVYAEHTRGVALNLAVFDAAVAAVMPYTLGLPSRLDIALGLPQVSKTLARALLDPKSRLIATVDAPYRVYTADAFAFLAKALPPFIAQWTQDAAAYLAGLVREKAGGLGADVDPLQLAAGSVFRCTLCDAVEAYPGVLSHACRRRELRSGAETDFMDWCCMLHLPAANWQPRDFESEFERLAPVVEAYGLDPRRASVQEMDASPVRLTCRGGNAKEGMTVMNWLSLVRLVLRDCLAAHS